MNDTMVLPAELGFAALEQQLAGLDWRNVGQATSPILPGEPEHAVFERGGAGRLFYSFNPVCRLRTLDVSEAAPAARTPLQALPQVDAPTVHAWLADPGEHTVLRGILAAGQLGEAALAPAVAAHAAHPRASIARLAQRTAADLQARARPAADAPAAAEEQAAAQALAAIEVLKLQLTPLLEALAADRSGEVAALLRPRPGDAARAFVSVVAGPAEEAYQAAWDREPPHVSGVLPGHRLHLHLAPAGMLADENLLSRPFPEGYRGIASLLQPHRTWVRWRYTRPGATSGQSYDGLVWLDNHWAWFPKPYRMLAPLLPS